MSKKKSWQQKMKDKNAELLKRISILIENPNSVEAIEIKERYNFCKIHSDLMWFATSSISNDSESDGIIKQILKNESNPTI